jgi:hypothetical protein
MPRLSRFHPKRGAIVMLLTVMMPFLIVPAAGLAIDATIIHIVQTKLQAAVDGSALGAGRLLGSTANISEIAGEFFTANFAVGQLGFWNATLPTTTTNPQITVVTGISKSVTVYAKANVPTLFMRILGFNQATVTAIAQAARRDARFEFVLDRSGSMATTKLPDGNYPIADVQSYAAGLIKGFTPGEDEVGVVVFDGSGAVAYPSGTTYNPTVVNTGGPDTSFWDGTSTGSSNPPDAIYQIGQVVAGGGTGTADALSLAYIELQKAHLRDLAANGVDSKMNAVLLFTDGVPSAISLYANDPKGTGTGGTWLTSGSGCSYYKGATYPSNPIYFWLAASGSPPYTSMYGANYQLMSYEVSGSSANSATAYTPLYWMQTPGSSSGVGDLSQVNLPNNEASTSGTKCTTNLSGGSWNTYLTQIPVTDKWGNSTGMGTSSYYPYHDSYFVSGSPPALDTSNYVYKSSSGDLVVSSTGTAYDWGLAMWDAVDDVGVKIRTDSNYAARGDTSAMYIQLFTIGYDGNGGTDAGLLKRLANDPQSTDSPNALPATWSTQPTGKFCLASNSTELANCFNNIGSILLRLTM